MIYIYIFEDGAIGKSEESPTEKDFESIAEGILEVLVINKGLEIYGINDTNENYEIDYCKIALGYHYL
jgi:hypothetical protein